MLKKARLALWVAMPATAALYGARTLLFWHDFRARPSHYYSLSSAPTAGEPFLAGLALILVLVQGLCLLLINRRIKRQQEAAALFEGITLRPCTMADLPLLLQIEGQCLHRHAETRGGDSRRGMEKALPYMRIIQIQGRDAGAFAFQIDENGDGRLGPLAVLPACQGRGIGSRVLQMIIEENPGRRLYLQIYKGNPARRLYQRAGFVVYGETQTHWLMHRAGRERSEAS